MRCRRRSGRSAWHRDRGWFALLRSARGEHRPHGRDLSPLGRDYAQRERADRRFIAPVEDRIRHHDRRSVMRDHELQEPYIHPIAGHRAQRGDVLAARHAGHHRGTVDRMLHPHHRVGQPGRWQVPCIEPTLGPADLCLLGERDIGREGPDFRVGGAALERSLPSPQPARGEPSCLGQSLLRAKSQPAPRPPWSRRGIRRWRATAKVPPPRRLSAQFHLRTLPAPGELARTSDVQRRVSHAGVPTPPEQVAPSSGVSGPRR